MFSQFLLVKLNLDIEIVDLILFIYTHIKEDGKGTKGEGWDFGPTLERAQHAYIFKYNYLISNSRPFISLL